MLPADRIYATTNKLVKTEACSDDEGANRETNRETNRDAISKTHCGAYARAIRLARGDADDGNSHVFTFGRFRSVVISPGHVELIIGPKLIAQTDCQAHGKAKDTFCFRRCCFLMFVLMHDCPVQNEPTKKPTGSPTA